MTSPLADRIRPETIDQIVGQKHLLKEGAALRNIIDGGNIPNMIFYGPSGVGKTTLARIIAKNSGKTLCKLNGTNASTADIREVVKESETLAGVNGVLLYLDEIQYFNKKQQQTMLEYLENGKITLIASTTENPYFYVYSALLSRSTVFEFKSVTPEETVPAVKRAFSILEEDFGKVECSDEMLLKIAQSAGGDVRKAITAAEMSVLGTIPDSNGIRTITEDVVKQVAQKSSMKYDREGDEHYDIISAFQKSMRGSDPDATVHYLARLLEAGDLPSACRRLLVCACEDVGLANPNIIPIVKAAVDSALMLGLPEARIPLADAAVLVAISPKSTSAYEAINLAWDDISKGKGGPIPRTLQNKHFDGEDAAIKGQFYKYPHAYKNHYVEQQYLPDALKNVKYYEFGDNKTEQGYKEFDKIRKGK